MTINHQMKVVRMKINTAQNVVGLLFGLYLCNAECKASTQCFKLSTMWALRRTTQIVVNFKTTVLEGYWEYASETGTVEKLSVSTFVFYRCFVFSFCFS